jgi:hypothetical protein
MREVGMQVVNHFARKMARTLIVLITTDLHTRSRRSQPQIKLDLQKIDDPLDFSKRVNKILGWIKIPFEQKFLFFDFLTNFNDKQSYYLLAIYSYNRQST